MTPFLDLISRCVNGYLRNHDLIDNSFLAASSRGWSVPPRSRVSHVTFDGVNGPVRIRVSGNNLANSLMAWQIICSGFIDQKVCVELSFLYKKGGSLSSKELRATFKVGHLCTDREKLSLAETGILPSSANIQNICFGLSRRERRIGKRSTQKHGFRHTTP